MNNIFKYYVWVWVTIFAVYNICVFAVPEGVFGLTRSTSAFSWGYAFASIAFIGQLFCSYRAFKALRSLPSSGIFPDEFVDRFQMKYEVVPYPGDRVLTTNHGEGELLLHVGNKNWNVKLDSGGEIILNEKNFKLL